MTQLKTFIMCLCIILHSTGINTRTITRGPAGKRLRVSDQTVYAANGSSPSLRVTTPLQRKRSILGLKEPCIQASSIKMFRKPDGTCGTCTDCNALRLVTRRPCSNYRDETCYNTCVESDAVYDPVISQCVKKKQLQRLTPPITVISKKPRMEIHTTDSTPSDLKLNSHTPKSLQLQASAVNSDFAKLVAVLVVSLAGSVATLLICQRKACTKQKHHREETHSTADEAIMLNLGENNRRHDMRKKTCFCIGLPDTRLDDQRLDPAYKSQEPRNLDMAVGDIISQSSGIYETINETQMSCFG